MAFRPDGRYKLGGDAQGDFWHVLGLRRFEPGTLSSVYSDLRVRSGDPLY